MLQNHYFNPSLTLIREDVPESYLFQFWLSANLEKSDDIVLQSINKAKLRVVLGLPSKNVLNLVKYSEDPTDEEIC